MAMKKQDAVEKDAVSVSVASPNIVDEEMRIAKRLVDQRIHRLTIIIMVLLVVAATISFSIAMALDHSFFATHHETLYWSLPLGIICNISFWTITAIIRLHVLKYYGFTKQDRETIYGNRKDFNLDYFLKGYESRTLKIVDGLPRKLNHIITSLFNIAFVSFVVTRDSLRLQVALGGQVLNLIVSYLLINSNGIVSYPFYGSSSRIRDGRFGRLNLILVRFVGLTTILTIGGLVSHYKDTFDEQYKKFMIAIVYIPTAVGDACGEIFGSLYGKHEFKVWGIGEINKKTVEGTVAVFLGSLLPMFIVSTGISLKWHHVCLFLVLSTQSTILELISARGTDNFTLPLSNALVVWLWTTHIHSLN